MAVLILYLLTRGEGSAPRPEPLPADAPATVETAPPPPMAALPPPMPAPLATAPVVAAPSSSASQLRLVGILASGALIAMADGTQRFVPVGREIVPGVTLRGVDVHEAILATPGGEIRLPLDVGPPPQQVVAPAATPPGTPPTP
ncbi:MAG: hypothetical protein JO290_09865 [Sphingomonadaceae bacterium]|nr:hypothetical protein [Sphingomonadaceae bacterium]